MSRKPTGCLAVTLHTHMPYVRKNGDWPCGEEWILEAWAECYLPFAALLRDLAREEATGRLAMTLTPVLSAQLADPHLKLRLAAYLANKMRQCMQEAERPRLPDDTWKNSVASFYLETYAMRLDDLSGGKLDLLEDMRRARRAGCLEVLASSATHAHLPLLPSDRARRIQVELGLDCFRETFAGYPAGFWLPECAFAPSRGLAGMLAGDGLRYTPLHHSALPEDQPAGRAYRLEDSALYILPVHPLPYDLVWERGGLPSGSEYRDYSKRDIDGHGLQYWRITSLDTPIEGKLPYDPEAARERIALDARAFVEAVATEAARSAWANDAAPPLIHACFDTELLGHWWYEGVEWLRAMLASAEAHPELELITPSAYLDRWGDYTRESVWPGESSWGLRHSFYTWDNPLTQEMLDAVKRCDARMRAAVTQVPCPAPPRVARALDQALRELLILQGSDWSFMVTREQAADYARERFAAHLERFEYCLSAAAGQADDCRLSDIEELDRLFPDLSFREYAG